MKNRRNYYRLLQVQPDAPFEVIRASYRALMRELKHHPDLGGDHWNAKVLNLAFETLGDNEKRARYDKELFKQYTKNPFSKDGPYKRPVITIYCPFCKRPMARKALPNESCPSCRNPLESEPEKPEGSCRRIMTRVKKSGQIRYYTIWPQKGIEAEMIDVSQTGMRFRCHEKLKPNSIIKISSHSLKASAKVRNSYKIFSKGRIHYSVGVHFLAVTFKQERGSFYSAAA